LTTSYLVTLNYLVTCYLLITTANKMLYSYQLKHIFKVLAYMLTNKKCYLLT
jgi:hypothetical protein